ncbi:haloacid dehalogenase, type II [Cyphellophora europaea CBS 101466]|uniref:Haloacid dehalogenase, type II n=1 Tax=Cyphellophora europaea (strain CBS 101466) TaxID=1220924 RepID=W2RLQ9_CYPE1|nr:haloacid dehalogenase, type II [Cyphellophora europaea CBS 101466]ETN37255.1 haloacid dehalogenase, type II [Cyphellophora europaea CBS 101466]
MSLTQPPKALLTDVFGTVVDWRGTVTTHLTNAASSALNSSAGSLPSATRAAAATVSWPAFAQEWRSSYYHFTRTYDPAKGGPFKSVDQHHLDSLMELLDKYGIADLWAPEEVHKLSLIWHFLDPWPDSAPGLGLLNGKFETCTLSNGNTSLLQDLATHGELPYKHIFSGEDFQAYKPHEKVYRGAAGKLGLREGECALVAAHLGDLEAARGCGYQTIYIEREQEEGWKEDKVKEAKGWVDMWVSLGEGGFEEVARRFGCSGEGSGKL